jgi:diguanylate cyclase (GGDEF)-like protein/PAS domain S-box-containing protein
MDQTARAAAIVASSSVAIISCDLQRGIASWNAAAEQLYGYSAQEMIGRSHAILIPPGSDEVHGDLASEVIARGGIEALEVERVRKNGERFYVSLNLSVIYDDDGKPTGICAVCRDITEKRRAKEALAESEERLKSLSDASFEGIAVSRKGLIVDANAAFVTLFGYDSLHEIIGKSAIDFAAPECGALVAQKNGNGEEGAYEALCQRKDGSTFCAELRGRQIPWRGELARVTAVQDITIRKETENALRRSEAKLIEAQRVAKMGSWDYDLATGDITWSSEMFRLMGVDPAQGEPDYPGMLAHYHPEDAIKLDALSTQAIVQGIVFAVDLRLAPAQGPLEWRHAAGAAIAGPDGKIVRLTGTVTDVTERMLSEERSRVLFENSCDGHLFWDKSGLIDCNEAAVAMFRCADKAEMLSSHPALMSPEFQPDGRRSAEKRIEIDQIAWASKRHRFEWTHKRRNGEEFPVEVTLTPVTLRERPVMLVNWHDLTEQKRAEQQIKDYAIVLEYQKAQLEEANVALSLLATTDGLTGLKNHRAFQERLSLEMDLAVRHHQPLSVVMLDVDHFKQFNDTFGHPEGDEVLRQSAKLLLTNVRETDMVARYGGEEFVVLLPQTDATGAVCIAERVRQAFQQAAWSKRLVTVSVGVASLGEKSSEECNLIDQADKALYRSKSGGRNRVTNYSE